ADLGLLCPQNFGTARVRALVTTDSNQYDRPAPTPWIFDLSQSTYAVQATGAMGSTYGSHGAPQGAAIQFPTVTSPPPAPPTYTEFNGDWRFVANLATSQPPVTATALGKVDLNRFLAPYPHMGSGTSWSNYSSTP